MLAVGDHVLIFGHLKIFKRACQVFQVGVSELLSLLEEFNSLQRVDQLVDFVVAALRSLNLQDATQKYSLLCQGHVTRNFLLEHVDYAALHVFSV